MYGQGRSKQEIHGESDDPGWIDLTNSLSDTKTGLESNDNPEDLISPHRTNVDLSGEVDTKTTKSAEIIKGMKMNLTLDSNPINIAPRPLTVVVTSSSVTSTNPDNSELNTNNNDHYGNPVDMIAPPTREQDNAVSYFTEESTSVKSFTKPPPRHIRNRHRYPLTNSHSLIPSTTTQINMENSQEGEQLGLDNTRNVSAAASSLDRDRDILTTKTNTSNDSSPIKNRNGNKDRESSEDGMVHLGPSDAINTDNEQMQNDGVASSGSISNGDLGSTFNQKSHHDNNNNKQQNAFEKRLGLAAGLEADRSGNNEKEPNQDDPQGTHLHHNQKTSSHSASTIASISVSEQPKRDDMRRPQDSTPDYFVPITPIISSERDEDDSLLNNHKMHLTFDSISPEFYDKNPWTPLLNRPNLDKRPRVDVVNNREMNNAQDDNPATTSEPIIVWNTGEEWASPDTNANTQSNPLSSANPPPHHYYGYGHSASSSDSRSDSLPSNSQTRNHNGKPTGPSYYNRPISHGTVDTLNSSDLKQENHDHTDDSVVNLKTTTTSSTRPHLSATQSNNDKDAVVEETTGGFRPVLIPSYTLMIPHIPNPPRQPSQNFASQDNKEPKEEAVKLFHKNESNRDNFNSETLNTSFKMDRMGEAEVSYEKQTEVGDDRQNDMKNVNASDRTKNDNEQGVKTKAEEIKDEDYTDIDEITVDIQSPTNIYKLDPDIVDIVPDTLGHPKSPAPHSQDLVRATTVSSKTHSHKNYKEDEKTTSVSHPSSVEETEQETIKPDEVDPIMKTTTDLIMSTLGSLNLIKSPASSSSKRPPLEPVKPIIDVESSPKDSDISTEEGLSESPLFPPVRSYVGVNLPLRPKPTEATETTGPMKQLRFVDGVEGGIGPLKPDLTTTASLQKVLSMMMKFDGDENSRNRQGETEPYVNVTKQNVLLMLRNSNGSLTLVNEPLSTTVPSLKASSVTTTHREQKSFSDRDSKIDEQFLPATSVEHVPVPLIVTESPDSTQEEPTHSPPSKLKMSSVKVNDQNSPVYKFVLKKGQSVEDLLKEIFHNYTDVVEEVYDDDDVDVMDEDDVTEDTPISQVIRMNASKSDTGKAFSSNLNGGHPSMGSMKSLDDSVEDLTTLGLSSTTVRINHHVESIPPMREPLLAMMHHPSTSDPPPLQTVTSIVINEELHISGDQHCPSNSSFKCLSTDKCIPSYLRCNFIKECPDNSDEENCSCADFLKANGNGRKLCDGVM
jgi:hypothetical protein